MRKGLLIVDVQNDYFPNGRCELFKAEETLENIKKLLEYFRKINFRFIILSIFRKMRMQLSFCLEQTELKFTKRLNL